MHEGCSSSKAEWLRTYLESVNAWFRVFELPEHTMTVDAAARQLSISPEKIIKTLVFINEKGEPLIAIVCGNKRVNLDKLAKVSGCSKVRMAKAREVEKFTGYPVGALPPVGHGIRTFIDREMLRHDKVVGGGGTTHTLMEMKSEDVVKLSNATICDISE